ncbi:hypothetical protein SteCoe_15820 [Stentor coeruleus]|uniref:Uncharacterized protein n=1 Tax=Stentor coeruleus TaxID=5963 RepID=A0A1R2C2Z9_9CILI|nr:hypothetical protein SteCoe_15820 [Stentor coeruleus]
MKKQKPIKSEEPIKEQPLKIKKDKVGKSTLTFQESNSSPRFLKPKIKEFKDMRKWDIELEKLDREEINIRKSLKEINLRIHESIHKRDNVKSMSQATNNEILAEKKKIDSSLNKYNRAVNQSKNKSNKLIIFQR